MRKEVIISVDNENIQIEYFSIEMLNSSLHIISLDKPFGEFIIQGCLLLLY